MLWIMLMTMPYLLLISLCFPAVVLAEEVYRSVDEDGNIIFSDEASPEAEKLIIREPQTIPAPDIGQSQHKPATKAPPPYTLAITAPANDATIRDNEGKISVSVAVTPGLSAGDKLVIYMDGNEVGTGSSVSLQNVDRGSHQLRAVIKDRNERIRKSSKSVTFHMFRHFFRPGT